MKSYIENNRAYIGFVWHAFFLALTMSMLDLNTVFPSLVDELTGSKALFGLLYSIMLGVPFIFNFLFSHYLKTKKYKKKFLLLGIYMRAAAFLGMALFTYFFGITHPILVFVSFFVWVFLFSVSAGLAGISYTDITAKTIPASSRTNLYAVKQFFSSIAALSGGLVVGKIFSLGSLSYPGNYSLSLLIGFAGLLVASVGFIIIKEPGAEKTQKNQEPLKEYIKQIPLYLKNDANFRKYIIVENLSSFGIMIMPFYMIYAKEKFSLDSSYIGRYLLFQIIGTILSTIVWAAIAKRFDAKAIVRFCVFLGGLIPLAAIGLSFLGPDYFAIVFLLIGFIISGRRIGFEPYLLGIMPDEHRTEYLGIRGTLNILTVVLPILGGFFIEWLGYYFVFILVFVIMIFTAFLLKKSTYNTDLL